MTKKADLREEIIIGYRNGKYTPEQCFDAFDSYDLWPHGKAIFWEIFVDGLLLFLNRKAGQTPPEPPPFSGAPGAAIRRHNLPLNPDNGRDMTPYDREVA